MGIVNVALDEEAYKFLESVKEQNQTISDVILEMKSSGTLINTGKPVQGTEPARGKEISTRWMEKSNADYRKIFHRKNRKPSGCFDCPIASVFLSNGGNKILLQEAGKPSRIKNLKPAIF